MARSRNIKPGLFKNEVLGQVDPIYTLLFCGLWTLADREGRLEDRPVRIRAELMPYRQPAIDELLDWLAEHGFIERYHAGGMAVIQICNFTKHQNPHHREVQSSLPAPPGKGEPQAGPGQDSGKPRARTGQGADQSQASFGQGSPASQEPHTPKAHGSAVCATPGAGPGQAPVWPQSGRADSLNPDSFNPDSVNSDSPTPDSLPLRDSASPALRTGPPVMNGHGNARADIWQAGQDVTLISRAESATEPEPEPDMNEPGTRRQAEPKSGAAWHAYAAAYQQRYGEPPVRNARVNKHLCTLVDRLGADDAPPVAAYYVWHNARYYVSRMHPIDVLIRDCEKLRTEWATSRRMTDTEARRIDHADATVSVFQRINNEQAQQG